MLRKIRKLKNEEHGQALVFFVGIFAILLAVMAFVVDVGSVYVEKAKLQNAVDAAALAGAYDLTGVDDVIAETIARGAADDYFDLNGYEDVIPIIDPEANSVKVSAIKNVNYTFAQIIGLSSANVKASATASISPADGVTGVIPVGIVQQTFNIGQEYTLKEGGGDGANGNFGGLDFGSLTSIVNSSFNKGGAALFQDLVTEGYDQPIFVGEKVFTEPGAMSGKSFTENKMAFIPLVDSMDVEGKKELMIVGFAAFKVKSYYEEKTEIDGKIVKKGVIVGTFEYDVAASSVAGTYPDSGLRNVRLTE